MRKLFDFIHQIDNSTKLLEYKKKTPISQLKQLIILERKKITGTTTKKQIYLLKERSLKFEMNF